MSRSRLFFLALLFLGSGCADADAFGPAVNDTLPPARMPVELQTLPTLTDFGKFEGGGKLLFQELDSMWLYTYVYFPRGKRYGIQLQHSPSAINVFFAAEIRRSRTARTFIKEHLALFLTSNFGDYGTLAINKVQAQGNAKLLPFALPNQPVVMGNTWTLEQNILTWDGALEHWFFKGQVLPLRLDSFLRETRKPTGTFPGVMLLR